MDPLTDPQAEVLCVALRGDLVRNQRGQFYAPHQIRGLTNIALKLIERGQLADDDPGPIRRWWGPRLIPVRTVHLTARGRAALDAKPGWGQIVRGAVQYRSEMYGATL